MKFCSLYSGSSGNCIFVASDNAKVLIDAGLPGKKIDEALKHIGEEPGSIDGIFITHEHSDHIKGVGVLSRKYDIPIYANENTWIAMESNIGKIKDGDIIEIDIPNRSINVRLSDEELAARPQQPLKRNRQVSKALKAYAQSVASADKGGVRIIED